MMAMHPVFESFSKDVRQRAFRLFVAAPRRDHYSAFRKVPNMVPSVMCPVGACLLAKGHDEAFIGMDGFSAAYAEDRRVYSKQKARDFIVWWDGVVNHSADCPEKDERLLAEAMGVPYETEG